MNDVCNDHGVSNNEFIIQKHSRRTFISWFGKAGIIVASIGSGIGLNFGAGQRSVFAASVTPDSIACPTTCLGPPSHYSTSCISGGKACSFSCPNCCWETTHQAYAYWVATFVNGRWICVFYCEQIIN